MQLKEEILKNSGLLKERSIKVPDENFHLWKGKPVKANLISSIEDSKCASCGHPIPVDDMELRPHDGDIVGFRGENYHRDCFSVPKDAKPEEKLSLLNSDDEDGFIVANISDDWDGSSDWEIEDED